MSGTGHYLRLLDDTQSGLRELLRVLTFVFEDPKDKFMKREFIREAVSILKGKRKFDDYFDGRDKFSKLAQDAAKKHKERMMKKECLRCCVCKRFISRSTGLIFYDNEFNVFCSCDCRNEFHKLKCITYDEYDLYTSTLIKEKILNRQEHRQKTMGIVEHKEANDEET